MTVNKLNLESSETLTIPAVLHRGECNPNGFRLPIVLNSISGIFYLVPGTSLGQVM